MDTAFHLQEDVIDQAIVMMDLMKRVVRIVMKLSFGESLTLIEICDDRLRTFPNIRHRDTELIMWNNRSLSNIFLDVRPF